MRPAVALICAMALSAGGFATSGGDTFELTGTASGAELRYVNDAGLSSSFGDAPVLFIQDYSGTVITVQPHVGHGEMGAERLTVNVLTEGYQAFPDVIDVPDGSDVIVLIVPGIF